MNILELAESNKPDDECVMVTVSAARQIVRMLEAAITAAVPSDDHAEPFACYRQAEGGFVCESTIEMERLREALHAVLRAADNPEQPGETQRLADITQIVGYALHPLDKP